MPKSVCIKVGSKTVTLYSTNFLQWLEANDYSFLQQITTDNSIVYATAFTDLEDGAAYKEVKRQLTNIKVGIDAVSQRMIQDMVSDSVEKISLQTSQAGKAMSTEGKIVGDKIATATNAIIVLLVLLIVAIALKH
jgi:lipopolysaccharide assembly outer membrane protein LptD (OstA)